MDDDIEALEVLEEDEIEALDNEGVVDDVEDDDEVRTPEAN